MITLVKYAGSLDPPDADIVEDAFEELAVAIGATLDVDEDGQVVLYTGFYSESN